MNILPTVGFPVSMSAAVQDYKKLALEYSKLTDPTLKAAYKTILDKKVEELRTALQTYVASVSNAIDALQVA